MAAALGIAEHNGWAEFVIVGVHGTAPIVPARYRVTLRDPNLPSQPYHHEALEMPLAEAQHLVDRVRHAVAQHARAALSDVQSRYSVTAVVLKDSRFSRLPDSVADVLSSWSMTCAADGMMYRESLADAAADLGMNVVRYPRKSDPTAHAADALGVRRARVMSLVEALGRPLGTPWAKEHRNAAAAALWVLARDHDVRI
jgi:hypothetical protein